MIFSVVYSYTDKEVNVTYRKRANVSATCPEKAKEKVSKFFLEKHDPNPTFTISSISVLYSVNYLIL